MNAPLQPETLQRHRFTVDEVLELTVLGFVDKRAQLLDGEIFDMPSDGDAHIRFTMALMQTFVRALPADRYFVGVQTTLRLSQFNAPSPDIYVLSGGGPKGDVDAGRILLVVEVADTSLADDLASSAARYARHGVRDYWVVDVNARAIIVHRNPRDDAYATLTRHDADDAVAPLLVPDIAISLAAIVQG